MARSKNGKSKSSKKNTGESTSKQSPQPGPSKQLQKSSQSGTSKQSEPQKKKIIPRGRSVMCVVGRKSFKINYKTLKEIKRLQKSTELCIPRLPFSRLLREVLQEHSQRSELRMSADAIIALQESAEMFAVNLMEDSNMCAAHAKRLTVRPNDMKLAMTLRRNH